MKQGETQFCDMIQDGRDVGPQRTQVSFLPMPMHHCSAPLPGVFAPWTVGYEELISEADKSWVVMPASPSVTSFTPKIEQESHLVLLTLLCLFPHSYIGIQILNLQNFYKN